MITLVDPLAALLATNIWRIHSMSVASPISSSMVLWLPVVVFRTLRCLRLLSDCVFLPVCISLPVCFFLSDRCVAYLIRDFVISWSPWRISVSCDGVAFSRLWSLSVPLAVSRSPFRCGLILRLWWHRILPGVA